MHENRLAVGATIAAMDVFTTTDAARVAGLAEAAVATDPVAHTILGTIAASVRLPDAAPWAAHPVGRPTTLAVRSQLHTSVVLTSGWTDIGPLAAAIAALDPPAAALSGPPETVSALEVRLPSATVASRMDERLFRLHDLMTPQGVAGSARLAEDDDTALLAEWFAAFAVEAFGPPPPPDPRALIERNRGVARCWIWCDPTGCARSFAVAHPAVQGVSRIGPVYTPPEHRGHGYGSAVTAAASRDILDRADVACLFTDLANPTSNAIYQAIGYRRVLDRTTVRFDRGVSRRASG